MENIRETTTTDTIEEPKTLKSRLEALEDNAKYGAMKKDTAEKEKSFKWPWKWKSAARKANSKNAEDQVLVLYYNKKGEIEEPKLLPLYSGNIVIYKNKAHEFDPRALWTMRIGRTLTKVYSIREIDRRPISNLDYDEVKARNDSTDSDEIMVKMVTKAVIDKVKKPINKTALIIGGLALAGIVIFFLMRGG